MAADLLDLLTAAEARAAVNLEDDDFTHEATLELYTTAVTVTLEAYTGPIVSRAVATCAANVATTVLELDPVTTEWAMAALRPGKLVTVGTAASPYAVAGPRVILGRSVADRTIAIEGPEVTTAISDTVRIGRYVDTTEVPRAIKAAASITLRSLWAVEQGSGTLGDPFAAGPLVVPDAALAFLTGLRRPGFGA